MVYYNGADYGTHWNDYKKNILPNIQYPPSFPLLDSITELSESFTNDSVKAVFTKHRNDISVYHVFINILQVDCFFYTLINNEL